MNIIRIHCNDEAAAASPPDLFGLTADVERFSIEVPAEVANVLAAGAPVFVGVSGGRDSQALAYRVCAHLDDIGHQGRRFLIHADLGRVDWRDSLPVCERLAQRLGVDMPVTGTMYSVLYEGFAPREAVQALMGRQLKEE